MINLLARLICWWRGHSFYWQGSKGWVCMVCPIHGRVDSKGRYRKGVSYNTTRGL